MALLLNRSDVIKLLPMSKAIDVVEAAFGELAAGTAEMPDRTVFVDPAVGGWIAYMPAYLKTGGALGIKAVTVYKENPSKFGLPTTIGTILVQDNQTGEVVAVMDGGFLTAARTGAVTGVATRHLARKNAKIAGIFGTGVQARQQVVGMAAARDLDTILAFSLDADDARRKFAESLTAETGVEVRLAASGEELCRESDIVALATTASKPIVQADWWKPGAHINAIGSHTPGVRELDTATIQRAKVVADQKQACLNEAGDIQIPIEEGVYSADDIHGDLGAVVNGTLVGRENEEEITLFKSVGLAIQDISCASLVYEQAKEQGVGFEFNFGG
ncbi:MAG: ornithine cyclodeaminase family protein [Chloroflexi bacterium]|jgi:alanine dehydrogenase|nr:ornithine cyclodeaminase family protein [Chloroflexota bacterium]